MLVGGTPIFPSANRTAATFSATDRIAASRSVPANRSETFNERNARELGDCGTGRSATPVANNVCGDPVAEEDTLTCGSSTCAVCAGAPYAATSADTTITAPKPHKTSLRTIRHIQRECMVATPLPHRQ